MKTHGIILQFIAYLTSMVPNALGINCFHCISPDKQYNATVRRQLATQTDVFFYPIGVKSPYCSESIDPEDPHIIEGEICSKYSMCVTLFPNLQDSTFVVRGCFENILRHSRRTQQQLHQDGCYMIRSLPMYSNTIPMDYVVCTCHGDYCNDMAMPDALPKPYSFGKSNILKLSLTEEGKALQLSSSSSSTVFVISIVWSIMLSMLIF